MAKIDDLKDAVTTLAERVNNLVKELTALNGVHAETAKTVAEIRREYDKEIALLKKDIEGMTKWKDDLKREQDEHGRRLWAFGPNVAGAIINVVLAAIVAYFVASR